MNPGIIPFPCRHSMPWSYEAWLWLVAKDKTTYKPPTNHLQTTYKPPTNHLHMLDIAGLLLINTWECVVTTFHEITIFGGMNIHETYLFCCAERRGFAVGFCWRCADGLTAVVNLRLTFLHGMIIHDQHTFFFTQINLDQLGIVEWSDSQWSILTFSTTYQWGFPWMGVPNNGWFIRENPILKWMMNWGYTGIPLWTRKPLRHVPYPDHIPMIWHDISILSHIKTIIIAETTSTLRYIKPYDPI